MAFSLTPMANEPACGLALRREVLGFNALVHEPGGLERDGLTKFTSLILSDADIKPIEAARGYQKNGPEKIIAGSQ